MLPQIRTLWSYNRVFDTSNINNKLFICQKRILLVQLMSQYKHTLILNAIIFTKELY